jgi:alkylhydroperoxidase family enzyme
VFRHSSFTCAQVRSTAAEYASTCTPATYLKKAGETDDRLFSVAAWREAPYFSDAERAALALTEAATRLSDKADPVPDEIWDDAARHYDEQALAGLVIHIALIDAWNRINATTKQVAGAWTNSADGQARSQSRSSNGP